MILLIQTLIILILACTLIVVYVSELRDSRQHKPHATLEEIWFGKERRRAVRIDTNFSISYSNKKRESQTSKVRAENISIGGAKIHIEEKLEKGSIILLEVKLPSMTKPIIAQAEVAWIEDIPRSQPSDKRLFGAGVRFINIKSHERKKLSQFIEGSFSAQ
ncbi:MAG: hypothetical protein COS99_06500 [Candidatus Omnitrophica bacterium CG07_land_8_20_14_0_80_42_15]|uniref:PilZ domain-containing protein n=1 Tax=Candidatus Aquitaenariimonas noxiae TaxID=1974741 RepID=A0A2J0KXV5_9BACT|nr:MAG: hypothetical protein COS99_06500 [Candidatus Omnitrophica bacterium CG07_land_8_20_14_0_80_42_15]